MLQSGRKGGVHIQVRGVQLKSIGCRDERRSLAPLIPSIPFPHILQNAASYTLYASVPQLLKAPLGARFQAGGYEDLDVGMGANNRADIAAVHDDAGLALGRRFGGRKSVV